MTYSIPSYFEIIMIVTFSTVVQLATYNMAELLRHESH